ncbi:4618_t:CDS:2 [Paraglomus brasilianum]|uniref:4618_t:CDS:1 n=1 Tax=Paraglomus brasilianum TaxID=144538 RepID=A0A9N9B970_9GLOM|nr:4618_t:CDS:2 [Paraglomus brasilianum]
MAPIFGNPFKTPTAKYLLPFMRFLNIPFTVSDIQSKNPYAPIAKTSTKTSDCIYAKLLVSLSHEFGDELLGLFAYGSRVYGNARPHSDVDVDVLINSQRKCRRNVIIDGLEELSYETMHSAGSFTTQITSYLRYKTLQEYVGKLAPPPALEAKDCWRPRYEIADLIRDLEDISFVHNEATAHFLLVKLVERLARIQEKLWHRWPEKLKRCIEGWETWDTVGGNLAKRALSSKIAWSERTRCARELAKYVLEPVGGVMPTEWHMDWEAIPPAEEPFIIPKIDLFI